VASAAFAMATLREELRQQKKEMRRVVYIYARHMECALLPRRFPFDDARWRERGCRRCCAAPPHHRGDARISNIDPISSAQNSAYTRRMLPVSCEDAMRAYARPPPPRTAHYDFSRFLRVKTSMSSSCRAARRTDPPANTDALTRDTAPHPALFFRDTLTAALSWLPLVCR